jgi:hypothetical protein
MAKLSGSLRRKKVKMVAKSYSFWDSSTHLGGQL